MIMPAVNTSAIRPLRPGLVTKADCMVGNKKANTMMTPIRKNIVLLRYFCGFIIFKMAP
jgi:hypothetical protein